jgi:hypothetical protein
MAFKVGSIQHRREAEAAARAAGEAALDAVQQRKRWSGEIGMEAEARRLAVHRALPTAGSKQELRDLYHDLAEAEQEIEMVRKGHSALAGAESEALRASRARTV